MEIGRLVKQDIRDVWPREDSDFTPWLAKPGNLDLLAEELGLGSWDQIVDEVAVGSFRADLVCRDMDGHTVVVENQFAASDHKHLGQILTYLVGTEAQTIVWIAEQIREEHRAVIAWLNDSTELKYAFFGVELEVWRIGDSAAAPKFEVVEQPNNWERRKKEQARASEAVDTHRRLEYWGAFIERWPVTEGLHLPANAPNHGWMKLAFSTALTVPCGGGIYAYRQLSTGTIGVYLSVRKHEPEVFEAWVQTVSAKNYASLSDGGWEVNSSGNYSFFITQEADARIEQDWPDQHEWMISRAQALLNDWKFGLREDVLRLCAEG